MIAGVDPRPNELVEAADDEAFSQHAYASGWTDGLPIVAPTEERVNALVEATGRNALEVLGVMPPGRGLATVHAVAVNAVMSGCLPEHGRVVVAAIEAVLNEDFNLGGIQATTNPVTPAIMVNGPVVEEIDMNAGHDCFGPGRIANAAIGRSVRLCLRNIGYAISGETDMSTQGQPGKYTFCFAENVAGSPWLPHHVERGLAPQASAVTVFQAAMVVNLLDFGSKTAESLLVSFAQAMTGTNTNNMQLAGGDLALILGPDHADLLGRDGWSKDDIKQFLFQNARIPFAAFSEGLQGCVRDWRKHVFKHITDSTLIPVVDDWHHIRIAVAGGAGSQSSFIPGFGDGFSVCQEIR
ncbi:MAG: hypothetical protein OEM40_06335 [Acidimicrobiia bacterium]|nr:hypothetical protein [Acidimicrobiia bacterium]